MIFDLMNTSEIVITYSIGLLMLYIAIRNGIKIMSLKWLSIKKRKSEVFKVVGVFVLSMNIAFPMLIPTTIYIIYFLSI